MKGPCCTVSLCQRPRTEIALGACSHGTTFLGRSIPTWGPVNLSITEKPSNQVWRPAPYDMHSGSNAHPQQGRWLFHGWGGPSGLSRRDGLTGSGLREDSPQHKWMAVRGAQALFHCPWLAGAPNSTNAEPHPPQLTPEMGDRKVHLACACEGEVGVRWPDSASWDLLFGTLSAVSSSTAALHFFAGARTDSAQPRV